MSWLSFLYFAVAMMALHNGIKDALNPYFEFKERRFILGIIGNVMICMLLLAATGWKTI